MYENANLAQQSVSRPAPELGRLKAAAERIFVATNRIENFLSRFHGPLPEPGVGSAGGPTSDSYRNDIEAVFTALDRLENSVAALDHIG